MKHHLVQFVEWFIKKAHIRLRVHNVLADECVARQRYQMESLRLEGELRDNQASLSSSEFENVSLVGRLEVAAAHIIFIEGELATCVNGARKLVTERDDLADAIILLKAEAQSAAAERAREWVEFDKHLEAKTDEVRRLQAQLDESIPMLEGAERMLPDAVRICAQLQDTSAKGTSGEWKRHVALDRLTQLHPDANRRDLSVAIEVAVWRNL